VDLDVLQITPSSPCAMYIQIVFTCLFKGQAHDAIAARFNANQRPLRWYAFVIPTVAPSPPPPS
jgi:hypothetical protein